MRCLSWSSSSRAHPRTSPPSAESPTLTTAQGEFPRRWSSTSKALALARNDPDLEQTVADLTQLLTPTKRPETKDGLSFEQMQSEIIARVPSPAAVAAPASAVNVPPAPPSAAPRPAAVQPAAQRAEDLLAADVQALAQQASDVQPAPHQAADVQPPAQQLADLQQAAQQAVDWRPPARPPTVLQPAAAQSPAPRPPTPSPQALQLADLQPPAAQVVTSRHNEAGRGRAERTVAALEEWLQAIDVTRANRSA